MNNTNSKRVKITEAKLCNLIKTAVNKVLTESQLLPVRNKNYEFNPITRKGIDKTTNTPIPFTFVDNPYTTIDEFTALLSKSDGDDFNPDWMESYPGVQFDDEEYPDTTLTEHSSQYMDTFETPQEDNFTSSDEFKNELYTYVKQALNDREFQILTRILNGEPLNQVADDLGLRPERTKMEYRKAVAKLKQNTKFTSLIKALLHGDYNKDNVAKIKNLTEKREDIYGDGHDWVKDMYDNALYFSETPEDFDERRKEIKDYLDAKARMATTAHPQTTPFKHNKNSMDAYMYTNYGDTKY